jgi:hypothetical protein
MSTRIRRTSGANVRNHVMSGAKPFSVDKDAVTMLLAAFGYPQLGSVPHPFKHSPLPAGWSTCTSVMNEMLDEEDIDT